MSRPVAVSINPTATYGVRPEGASKLLPAAWANEPKSYYHYPEAWLWDAKRGFYPNLNTPGHRSGTNGVEEVRDNVGKIVKGRTNANGLHTGCKSKGGIEIDPADKRLGPWMGFIKKVPTEDGGHRHVFGVGSGRDYRGERFTRLANGKIRHTEAGDLYLDFCAFLRDEGLVHPVDEGAVEGLIEIKTQARDQLLKLGDQSRYAAGRADLLTAEIDAMRAEWDRIRAANVEDDEAQEGEEIGVEDAGPDDRVTVGDSP